MIKLKQLMIVPFFLEKTHIYLAKRKNMTICSRSGKPPFLPAKKRQLFLHFKNKKQNIIKPTYAKGSL